MKMTLLIAAVLVLPLVWGYLAERLLRRFWPQKPRPTSDQTDSHSKDDPLPFFPDYQI